MFNLTKEREKLDDVLDIIFPYPFNELSKLDKSKRRLTRNSIQLIHVESTEEYRQILNKLFDENYKMSNEEFNSDKYQEVRRIIRHSTNQFFLWRDSNFVNGTRGTIWKTMHNAFGVANGDRLTFLDELKNVKIEPEWLNLIPPDSRNQSLTEEVILEF